MIDSSLLTVLVNGLLKIKENAAVTRNRTKIYSFVESGDWLEAFLARFTEELRDPEARCIVISPSRGPQLTTNESSREVITLLIRTTDERGTIFLNFKRQASVFSQGKFQLKIEKKRSFQ